MPTTNVSESRLQRFLNAQNQSVSGFDTALSELQSGCKQGHWIWYVFPQLSGLGASSQSQIYGIDGIAEAVEYLRNSELRSRLLTITTVVAERARSGVTLRALMGSSIDVLKLVSSLTLFENVAKKLYADEGLEDYDALGRVAEELLALAAAEGYPPCRFTLAQLRQSPAP
jgi:uncharacterized protein (DUF1810 family)